MPIIPKILNIERLQSTLLNSGLQTRDQPTFQVLTELIKAARNLQAIVTALENIVPVPVPGGGDSTPTIEQAAISLIGTENYLDQDSGFSYIPGPQGIQGREGQRGYSGIDGINGEDGIDGFPGQQGAQGNAGSTGATGPAGIIGLNGADGIDGIDGLDGFPGIQGMIGLTGLTGRNGFDGLDGLDGLDSFIPGPQGFQGIQGLQGRPGIDGIDNSDWDEAPFVFRFPIISGGSGTPGGSDTQVQFNDSGAFGGDAGLTYNKTTDELTLAGDLILSGALNGIRGNTVDGADNKIYYITGGGAASTTRGGLLNIGGNESGSTGSINLAVGNVAGSGVNILRADGNLALNLDGATGVLSLLYGQIKFPATQVASTNANTLDDYEEGTWTPTDASGAGLALVSPDSHAGSPFGGYVKIGQMVYLAYGVEYPVTANATQAAVGSFPFTTENNTPAVYWGQTLVYTNSNGVMTSLNANVTKVSFYAYPPAPTAQTNVQMSGKYVYGNLQFRATA